MRPEGDTRVESRDREGDGSQTARDALTLLTVFATCVEYA